MDTGEYALTVSGGGVWDEVKDARQGKFIELDLAGEDAAAARARVEAMCQKLLANTVIENYAVEIV
mgnify:CR=1 FL=1